MVYVDAIEKALESPLNNVVLVTHSSVGLVGSVVARRLAVREVVVVVVAGFLPQRGG